MIRKPFPQGNNPSHKNTDLIRQIGIVTTVCCGVGSIIGSGIFKKPGVMATQLGSPDLIVLVWIITGFMTLFGSLSIAELSGMFTGHGGQFLYFTKSYNRFVGYLYGWAVLAVIQTGSIASIAYVFSDSLGYFTTFPRFPAQFESWALHIPLMGDITPCKFIGLKLCTISLLMFLTTMNYLGVKIGGVIQVAFTVTKVLVILVIIGCSFLFGNGNTANFHTSTIPQGTPLNSIFLSCIIARSGAFWAYDGWINVTFVSGEITNPQRTLPKSMLITSLIVMVVYILVNLAYLYIIPIGEMAANYLGAEERGQSYLVVTDVVRSFWGDWSGGLIAVAIMISTFGTVNGTIMMSARVAFAMSREGLFFRKIGEIHPRFMTPGASLVLQGIWASLLVLSGTFDQLTDMLIFVSWIFYGAAAFGVLVLRKKMPNAPRPYKVWGYPFIPLLFTAFAFMFIIFTLYSDIRAFQSGGSPLIDSLMGVLLVALGIPGYLYWERKRSHATSK